MSELSAYGQKIDAMRPVDADRGCHADLGSRYVLVVSRDHDLTGVAVDDFGCNEVRLTDDPFRTAPGEATGDGAVSGVLHASPTLLASLKRTTGTDQCLEACG